jgi:hypothetical protein
MGFETEFNWVMKLSQKQGLFQDLKEGGQYKFNKQGFRVYPVEIPLDLVNENWEAIAKVVVEEFKNYKGKTFGTYRVVRLYSEKEKKFLSSYWQENAGFLKEPDSTSPNVT